MKIRFYSRPGCGKCESAKQKIKLLGFEYEEHTLEYHITLHDGWRKDGTTELMAYLAYKGDPKVQLPTIQIDEKYFDYPGAMRELKKLRKVKA